MSQSVSNSPRSAQGMPWNDQQVEQVKGLRKAISAREDAPRVDNDVAPLMAELLAPIQLVADAKGTPNVCAPSISSSVVEPSAQNLYKATHSVRGKIAGAIQHVSDDSHRQALVQMLKVVDKHIQMKQEVIFRVQENR